MSKGGGKEEAGNEEEGEEGEGGEGGEISPPTASFESNREISSCESIFHRYRGKEGMKKGRKKRRKERG